MKLVGFIREYHDLPVAIGLRDFIDFSQQPYYDSEKMLKYLDSGFLLLAWMGYFFDDQTDQPIAPDSYLTDGLWVWPAYLSYYVKKNCSLMLDQDFVAYVISKDYRFELDADFLAKKEKYEADLSLILNG